MVLSGTSAYQEDTLFQRVFSIVNFLKATINVYKSCPEHFLQAHMGIWENSPITHSKLEAEAAKR